MAEAFSSLVETTSGRRFIMKLGGVGQGASGQLAEFIALRLANVVGLTAPRVAPIMLSNYLPAAGWAPTTSMKPCS